MAQTTKAFKILLVDDDADILELLEYNLLKENFLLAKATNGKEAIAVAKTFQPHLIIMDVMMPEMDGIEAARQIKSNPEFKNTLILFLTARGEEYTEIAAFESGATDYVVKPIKLRALISRINALLTREAVVPESKNDRISIGDLVSTSINRGLCIERSNPFRTSTS
jgi:two-component system alkaline phosphatase synthesis response regulator PhoP